MIDDIYNTEVLRLAADVSLTNALISPDAKVSMRSPLCGSTIEVSLCVNRGRVSKFGQNIKACALGQASASVLARNVINKNTKDIQYVRDQLEAMLKSAAPPPRGVWEALSALEPARDAKPRHGAILLPLDAVLKGLEDLN